VNKVRREEHAVLQTAGHQRVKGTRFLWPYNPDRSMTDKQWRSFESLRSSTLKKFTVTDEGGGRSRVEAHPA